MLHFNRSFYIGDNLISDTSRAFIIAEAGVNHNGNMETARKLIDAAVEAGADAVKFQAFKAEEIILKDVEKAPYQKQTTDAGQSQYEMLKQLEVSLNDNLILKNYCQDKKILFMTTPFEKKSLDEVQTMDLPAIKIAATDLTNIQYLRQVAKVGKPIILSAGMCYLEEIQMALEAIYPYNKDVVLLQCSANYPLDDEEVNLNVIDTLKKEFDIIVGYSDHSKGIGASPYAIAKGAKVVEKHFTLNRDAAGPDHKASVTPDELKQLVAEVRRVEKFLGTGVKKPTFSEQFTRKSLQKSMVASRSIKCGECFTENNIVAKRTNGKGISALYFDELVGRKAMKDFDKDEIIQI